MFDGNFRTEVAKRVDPIGAGLNKIGITADVLTVLGVVMAVGAAVVIGDGHLRWGFVVMLAAAVPDLLDGPVAKAAGSSSKRGAFFDSSMDRVSDALIFGGITWYLASNEPGRISLLPVAIMAAALITSYLRAKGELLGYDAKGGIMERAERYIAISVALVFNQWLIPILWIMFALTMVTVLQRFVKIWRQATDEMPQRRTGQSLTNLMAPNYALLGFRTIATLARTLPQPAMSGLCRVATFAIPSFAPDRKRIVARNLERGMGRKLTAAEERSGVRAVFRSYARYWTDSTRLPNLTPDDLDRGFTFEGYEHIENSVAAGKGTILVLPHLGGWEFAGSWLSKVPKFDVTAVVEPLENEEVREFMHDWRSGAGMQVVALGKGLGSDLLKRLRDNHVICLMSDRNLGDGGIDVDFFGETTQLPGGAATLALRTGASIVPVCVYHRGEMNHAIVEPPVPAERIGRRMGDDIKRITQDIAHVMEKQVRREPTQWLLLQPNWPSDLIASDATAGDED